ncbi:hypothetical protein BDY21DRAFT_190767 [Lineolata rhizophorae]|uniref:Uncharacterized protein n=1 Tax=Lineolata rhizophorae TaxID=578093 RepID=A0A6A6P6L3_9PEZI|nr:hypothetical protein BDY21DRAFT_190767 [Lineolata rhizophorae]
MYSWVCTLPPRCITNTSFIGQRAWIWATACEWLTVRMQLIGLHVLETTPRKELHVGQKANSPINARRRDHFPHYVTDGNTISNISLDERARWFPPQPFLHKGGLPRNSRHPPSHRRAFFLVLGKHVSHRYQKDAIAVGATIGKPANFHSTALKHGRSLLLAIRVSGSCSAKPCKKM